MKVGDLVKYRHDGDIGIITERNRHLEYFVEWASGTNGYHIESELEVINESR